MESPVITGWKDNRGSVLHAKKLFPPLDYAASADHALERFAPLPGGIEHRAIFQGAGVLGGDQRAFDHGFAVAQADVGDL